MGIRKLYSVQIELAVRGGIRSESFIRLKSKVTDALNESKESTDFRMFSHLPVAMKLYIVKNYYVDIYVKIFDAVKELFMEIEDLDVEEDRERDIYLVTIKVYGKNCFSRIFLMEC